MALRVERLPTLANGMNLSDDEGHSDNFKRKKIEDIKEDKMHEHKRFGQNQSHCTKVLDLAVMCP